MKPALTDSRLKLLRTAYFHRGVDHGRLGVVSLTMVGGWEARTQRRNAAWLVENGYLEPTNHGDWYLTEKADAAIRQAGFGDELDRAIANPRG